MRTIKDGSLYLVISEEYSAGRSACDIAERAIAGGVDIVQMREKHKSTRELTVLGAELAKVCKKAGTLFIVNDDPKLAKVVGADGVHLGQEDAGRFPIGMARDTIGRDRIIGISTHSLEEFRKANDEDVDYIAFGPVFPTKTKNYAIGTSDIAEVVRITKKPVFVIGGIGLANIDTVLELGSRNVALIRGITETSDITAAARAFKERLIMGTVPTSVETPTRGIGPI